MKYYTFLSHHDPKQRDAFYYEKQLPDKHLSIGWGSVNPIGSNELKIKYDIDTLHHIGGTNTSNGVKSLSLFTSFKSGNIVFIRGNAKILDAGIITGPAFYKYGNGHDKDGYDYCLKVPFTPFFENKQLSIQTKEIPDEIYGNILEKGGYTLVLRSIDESNANQLLKMIMEKN